MVLHVLSIDNPQENEDLRSKSESVTDAMVSDKTYSMLAAKLLATVQAPDYDGVGIAAPQVGILRRVVAVMRYDKEGNPFEVYPDIRITAVIFQHECDHLDGIVYVDKGFDIKDIDE